MNQYMFMKMSHTITKCNNLYLFTGEYTELEFETYLVTVERQIQSTNSNTNTNINTNIEKPAYKVPRFKPPSFVEKKQVVEIIREETEVSTFKNSVGSNIMQSMGKKKGGAYAIQSG